MTLAEARKVLGLGPGEDPRPHLADFNTAREHIASMVRTAPPGILADRYRKGLEEFDGALTVVHEYLGITPPAITPPAITPPAITPPAITPPAITPPAITPPAITPPVVTAPVVTPPVIVAPVITSPVVVPPVVAEAPDPIAGSEVSPDIVIPSVNEKPPSKPDTSIPPPPPTVKLGEIPAPSVPLTPLATEEEEEETDPEKQPSRALSYLLWFLVFFLGAAGGAWIYVKSEQSKEEQLLIRVAFLERQGSAYVENRRWQEAAAAFEEIEKISPGPNSSGKEIAARGRRSIEYGRGEEQTQFIGYWTGQAIAELDAGRLDQAEAAVKKVLEEYPGEKEASAILERIAASRLGQVRAAAITAAKEAMAQRKWGEAIAIVNPLLAKNADDPEAKTILTDSRAGQDKATADQAKARDLLAKAIDRDKGQFDQQVLDWLREAASLAPGDAEITARLEKQASYTRTLRVPGDFATPAEALASAHDRDRVVIGPGDWKGPLVINAAVDLQGAGLAHCRIECPPGEASAITIGPAAKGARVSGITFRHESFAVGADRYSVALVRGGSAAFTDCKFTEASGHGLAIIEGGQVTVSRSRFSDNGWNGIAVIGQGSTLEARECESMDNFEHGIESWDGAAVILVNNRCEGNSRNGIHADNGLASASIEGNQLIGNREFGLVLDSAASGKITGNTAKGNLLGGFVIRQAAAKVVTTSNQANLNKGPGIVLEKGLPLAAYANNSSSQNTGQQVLGNANLTTTEAPVVEEGKAPRATVVEEPAIQNPVIPEEP